MKWIIILLMCISISVSSQPLGYFIVTKNYNSGETNIIKTVDYDDVQVAYKNLTNWNLQYAKITSNYTENNDNWYFYIEIMKVKYKYDKVIYRRLNRKDLKRLKL